jgi:arylsulfatase A-like enzyme
VGTRFTLTGTHATDYLADEALAYLSRHCPGGQCSQPFFMLMSFETPHQPAEICERHANLFRNFVYRERGYAELPDGDLTDKPFYVQATAAKWKEPDEDAFHKNYMRSLRCIDEAVKDVVLDLNARGLMDNTVVIFASDHGLMWGEHFQDDKERPYEEAIRTPLAIRHPAFGRGTVNSLVTFDLDLGPTILEIAGLAAMPGSDGTSLMPLLADPGAPWRDALLLEAFPNTPIPNWVAIRTADNWKYVEYVSGEKELYDLTADPYELISLHSDPAYQAKMDELAARLATMDRGISVLAHNLPDPQVQAVPAATLGQSYAFQFLAWGGDGQYSWTLSTEGTACMGLGLPDGLSLTTAGQITGTATLTGTYRFCAKVVDGTVSPQPSNTRTQEQFEKFSLEVVAP